jgi:succinate-acetate transporter protein
VLVLGLANARVFSPNAIGIFVPVAMATGGFCLLIGGLFEFRANNTFGGTFAVLYAGFLLTTGLILRWFAGDISTVAGALAFGDAFGSWLLLWGVFTVLLSVGAWYINMPAFLAFALLALAYFVLGFANIMNPGDTVTLLTKIGGWVLIIDGICAWYLAWAASLNSLVPDKLPLWPYPYSHAEATAPTSTPAVPA